MRKSNNRSSWLLCVVQFFQLLPVVLVLFHREPTVRQSITESFGSKFRMKRSPTFARTKLMPMKVEIVNIVGWHPTLI